MLEVALPGIIGAAAVAVVGIGLRNIACELWSLWKERTK